MAQSSRSAQASASGSVIGMLCRYKRLGFSVHTSRPAHAAAAPNRRRRAWNRNSPPQTKPSAATMAPPAPLRHSASTSTNGSMSRCGSGSQTVPSCSYPGVRRSRMRRARLRGGSAALSVTSSSAARASKRGDLAVVAETRLDVITGQRPEAIRAELLAAEATHYATIDRGPGQLPRLRRGVGEAHAARGQIADEAPRETVARPGGILQRVQQNAGDIRVAALMKKRRAVLAALDHQDPRAHRADGLGGALQNPLA